jgi:hypothetical protein
MEDSPKSPNKPLPRTPRLATVKALRTTSMTPGQRRVRERENEPLPDNVENLRVQVRDATVAPRQLPY